MRRRLITGELVEAFVVHDRQVLRHLLSLSVPRLVSAGYDLSHRHIVLWNLKETEGSATAVGATVRVDVSRGATPVIELAVVEQVFQICILVYHVAIVAQVVFVDVVHLLV